MASLDEALKVLQATSQTFYLPLRNLPTDLQLAVCSTYLCMRAIDEIEDHPTIDTLAKTRLLQNVSLGLQGGANLRPIFDLHKDLLPPVTILVDEWLNLAPSSISPRIADAASAMADRMAYWVAVEWRMHSEVDLNRYTFGVAGGLGLLLSDLWAWYDGTRTNRRYAVGFGRALQAVNILRNRQDDLARGVDFFPSGWGTTDVAAYARYNLTLADAYLLDLPEGPISTFCTIPLRLAYAALQALTQGRP